MKALYACVVILVFLQTALAADITPVEPDAPAVHSKLSERPKYWTKLNIALVSADAAAKSMDEWYTMRDASLPDFHENDPLARPFVTHGRFIAGASQGVLFAAEVFTSYELNKHGHPKMAKILLLVGIGGNTAGVATSSH